jgi:hypothetical protein
MKDEISQEVLKLWPECPSKYLKEAFYFKQNPTAEKIVSVASLAEEVGADYWQAEHFLTKMGMIREIEKIMIEKFGDEMADFLYEIRNYSDTAIMLASLWNKPISPFHYKSQLDPNQDSHLIQAAERAQKTASEMYGEDFSKMDNRTMAEFRLLKTKASPNRG